MANKPNVAPQNTEIDKLLDTTVSKVRGMFIRLGFHFLAFMTAILLTRTVTDMTFPNRKVDISDTSNGVVIYLSLLVIFPRRNQPVNSAIALLTALIWCFFGPWQVALAWGAIQRILLDIIDTKVLFHWRKIGTLFLCLLIFSVFFDLVPIAFVPGFFLLLFAACTVLGIYAKPFYTRYKAVSSAQPTKKTTAKPATESISNSKYTRLGIYKKLVDQLLKQSITLPENLALHVTDICQQTQLILHSMETDPRDFDPGEKFLKRYLVAVQKIIEQSQKLLNSPVKSQDVENALQESESLLIRLSAAFTEQQARLLENDMQDLTIELNLLDKLLKMEGYK